MKFNARTLSMCLALGFMLSASAALARSDSLRTPVAPHRTEQTVLWQGEELSVEPQETFVQEYSNLILLGMLGVALGVFYFAKRRAWMHFREECPSEEVIDEVVDALSKDKSGRSYAVVPRALPTTPFTEQNDINTLAREIEIAARASTRLSRTVGLIYFEPENYAECFERHGGEKTRQAMSSLVAELRQSLRSSDHVTLLGDNKVLICVCLLAGLTDLESITRRMVSIVARLGLTERASQRAGLAIYPINGYSGSELIRAAEENFLGAAKTAEEIAA